MKESGLKKHEGSSYGECIDIDRLSELPDEILVHILSFLPTIDAVRTVLLRRFGNLWTLIPSLKFNEEAFEIALNLDDDEGENTTALFSRFSVFIRNVLTLYKRPTIDKFCLEITKELDWRASDSLIALLLADVENLSADIEVWIRLVLSKEVKDLILYFNSETFDFVCLPGCIFTSHSLVSLRVQSCTIELSSRVHMRSLRILELYCVIVDDDDFNELVSGCPSLQELIVSGTLGLEVLSFSAPSIQKLELEDDNGSAVWTIDCPNLKILNIGVPFEYVKVVNLSSVRQVTFSYFLVLERDVYHFKRFLEGVQNAEVLIFKEMVDELLTYCLEANVGLPLGRWKRVVLSSSVRDAWVVGICSLVKSSPWLEELIIHVCYRGRNPKVVSQEAPSACVASHLRLVSMHGYGNPYEGQLRLAEFLLKSAVNLEKLVIFSNRRSKLSSSEEQQFVKQLSNFPRASRKARVVFE